MSIPAATTQLQVQRAEVPVDTDGYDPTVGDLTTVLTGLRAVINKPSATVGLVGGERTDYNAAFVSDVADLEPGDTVTDSTGTTWILLWARAMVGFGLDHMEGSLRLVTGVT